MGFLKYLNHDAERQHPVNFHWEILDFDPRFAYEFMMGLQLQPAPGLAGLEGSTLEIDETQASQALILNPAPEGRSSGVRLSTREFRATVIDYESKDRRNRTLGKAGERLVLEHEQKYLNECGRSDLASLSPVTEFVLHRVGAAH